MPAVKHVGRLALLGRSKVIDHAADGISGLVSIVGVKYTTARSVAEAAVDLVLSKLAKPAAPCRTAQAMLPTAGPDDLPPDHPTRHAVEVEMAQTLTDVVVRRTGLGAAGYPGDLIVNGCASEMQQICGWPAEKLDSEIAALKRPKSKKIHEEHEGPRRTRRSTKNTNGLEKAISSWIFVEHRGSSCYLPKT